MRNGQHIIYCRTRLVFLIGLTPSSKYIMKCIVSVCGVFEVLPISLIHKQKMRYLHTINFFIVNCFILRLSARKMFISERPIIKLRNCVSYCLDKYCSQCSPNGILSFYVLLLYCCFIMNLLRVCNF